MLRYIMRFRARTRCVCRFMHHNGLPICIYTLTAYCSDYSFFSFKYIDFYLLTRWVRFETANLRRRRTRTPCRRRGLCLRCRRYTPSSVCSGGTPARLWSCLPLCNRADACGSFDVGRRSFSARIRIGRERLGRSASRWIDMSSTVLIVIGTW